MASWARTTSLSIDVKPILRRIKPEKRLKPLTHGATGSTGPVSPTVSVLLDTNIYIRDAAGTLPSWATAILDQGHLFHCSICAGELMTGVGNLSPASRKWRATRDHYADLIRTIPASRLLTPDEDIWVEAGLVAGVLARTQGFQPHQRKECLNDALIFLTAVKSGLPILTADGRDFDLIRQVCGRGHYIAI